MTTSTTTTTTTRDDEKKNKNETLSRSVPVVQLRETHAVRTSHGRRRGSDGGVCGAADGRTPTEADTQRRPPLAAAAAAVERARRPSPLFFSFPFLLLFFSSLPPPFLLLLLFAGPYSVAVSEESFVGYRVFFCFVLPSFTVPPLGAFIRRASSVRPWRYRWLLPCGSSSSVPTLSRRRRNLFFLFVWRVGDTRQHESP